jgi:hypothetical protein
MTEKINEREWNKTYVERSAKERKALREKIEKENYLQKKLHKYNKDLEDVVDSINKAFEYYSENEVKYLTEGRTDGFYLKKVDKSASKHEVVKRVINHEMMKPRNITDYDKKEELIDKGYSQEERKIIWMFQMNMINNDFKVRTIKEVLPEEKYQEIINSVNKVLKGDRTTDSEIDLLYSLKRLKKQGIDIIEQIEDIIESEHFRIRLEKAELKEFEDFKEEIESFEYKNKLKQNKKYMHRLI